MEKLNEYLQTLLSTCSYELHLEPNKNPYLVSANGTDDVSHTPLLGTQISMMIFPLIPANVKRELPNSQQIEFVHPHNLGEFSFTVKKSPSGFNVTIRPKLSDNSAAGGFQKNELTAGDFPAQKLDDFFSDIKPQTNQSGMFSNFSAEKTFTPSIQNTPTEPEIEFEEPLSKAEADFVSLPPVETMSVNDPEFSTVFSDSSTYEPPIKKSEFAVMPETNSVSVIGFESSAPPTENIYSSSPEIFPDLPVSQPTNLAQETPFNQISAIKMPIQHTSNMEFNHSSDSFNRHKLHLSNNRRPILPPPVQPDFAPPISAEAEFVSAQANPQAKARMDNLFQIDGGSRRVGFASFGQYAADDSQRRQNAKTRMP